MKAMTMNCLVKYVSIPHLFRANLSPQTWFEHDNDKVYVFFDACHLIKLMRNTLDVYVDFVTDDGRVYWAHLEILHKAH